MARFFHHRLQVYQKALDFVVAIDSFLNAWPAERRYLVYQIRRAASSICLNIAEAAHEIALDDRRRIFRYARRSAGECVSVLDVALGLHITNEKAVAPFYDQLNEIIAMLTGLTRPKQ